MKKLSLLVILTLLMSACSPDLIELEAPSITWENSNFLREVDMDVQNVTDLLIAQNGALYASFYDEAHTNYIGMSDDNGASWTFESLPREVINIRAFRELSDGSFLIGSSSKGGGALLYRSDDALNWTAVETQGLELPNESSTTVWDILELPSGKILLATDDPENDPEEAHPTLYLLDGNKLKVAGEFPGLGVLALEVDRDGTIYIATEESAEHNDPALAGQARIFTSTDEGETWTEVDSPEGANRVYDILAASDGTIYLGTGISGEFFRSKDQGASWELMTHVPNTDKPMGNGQISRKDASRIYQMIELPDGTLVVGTGNNAGSVFLTQDGGETWIRTEFTGQNVVAWGLTYDPISNLLWVGTGSFGGNILTGVVE